MTQVFPAKIASTVKILLEVDALLEADAQVLTPKMPIFQYNFQKKKKRASKRRPPTNIEIRSVLSYAE